MSTFSLNDYDVVAFDMDHTLVQYHLPEIFKLIYTCAVDYLVKEKNYGEFLHHNNFEKYEDFSIRGLIFDCIKGNFLKLDKQGYILSCSHGMKALEPCEIVEDYGTKRIWSKFDILNKKVHHGDGFGLFDNFFLMPAVSLIGQMVEDADRKNNGLLCDYTHIWSEIRAALMIHFQHSSFKDEVGNFFPSIKSNIAKYVKKTPEIIIKWIERLRKDGKLVVLITDSYGDFADFIMNFAFGSDWRESFDFIVVAANKPNFFKPEFSCQSFLKINEFGQLLPTEVIDLQRHTMGGRGHASALEETIRSYTGKEKPKIVYFGDSMKSDIYPPKKFRDWDTVAVLEEMEAEEVHFHKNNSSNLTGPASKKMKMQPLLKEEKLLLTSSQWGSFFTHPYNVMLKQETDKHLINTFWGHLVQTYSKLAIPLLDYLAEQDIKCKYNAFSAGQYGFYPSAPRSLEKDNCSV